MKRNILTTADGSKTIQIEEWNEQYHSMHGAIQEAEHVFLKHGLLFLSEDVTLSRPALSAVERSKGLSILEVGFGTGLNAFLTLLKADDFGLNIHYTGVEAFPVSSEEVHELNYVEQLSAESFQNAFDTMHECSWETEHAITSNFYLTKLRKDFGAIKVVEAFDLIYFDAFSPRVQPELWTETIFKIMYNSLKPNGVLVTYSAKGDVRRAMQAVGFSVEKLPGPPGKREMLRAIK